MNLFLDNGHLSDEGLGALTQGMLDDLQCLEAAEHLGFCDECLMRYTSLLEKDTLLSPAEDTAPVVLKGLKKRQTRRFINRYTSVAAALILAAGIWSVCLFTGKLPQARTKPENGGNKSISSWMNEAAFSFNSTLNDFFAPKPSVTGTPSTPTKPPAASNATELQNEERLPAAPANNRQARQGANNSAPEPQPNPRIPQTEKEEKGTQENNAQHDDIVASSSNK